MKYFIALVVAFAAISANAQTEKGSWMIGGTMRVENSSTTYLMGDLNGSPVLSEYKTNSFTLNPTVGYFFVKNLMTGVQLGYTYNWTPKNTNSNSTNTGIGPIVRYYVPLGKFAVFPEIAYSYSVSSYKLFNPDTGTFDSFKPKAGTLRGGIGLAYFVSPNIGIEGILAYQKIDQQKTEQGDSKSVYFNIGLQFYLPKKD